MMVSLVAVILTLLLVIGIHEAGHAVAGKYFGIKIERVSIGFGRPLFLWKTKHDLEWVWAIWPLGGYVQFLESHRPQVEACDLPRCFDQQLPYKRILVLVMGGVANLGLAIIALSLYFMIGHQYLPTVVPQVLPASIAAKSGLLPGMRIVQVNEVSSESWRDVSMALMQVLGQKDVKIKVETSEGIQQELLLNLTHDALVPAKRGLLPSLGLKWDPKAIQPQKKAGVPLNHAFREALRVTGQIIAFYGSMVKQVLIGNVPFSMLLGPLGVFSASITSFASGLANYLYYIANFSLLIALFNWLPFPGLDGSSIVLTLVEKARGKPVSQSFEWLLYRLATIASWVILFKLFMNDIQRLF